MKRMTPCVEGCCGPMFTVISSPLSYCKMRSDIFALWFATGFATGSLPVPAAGRRGRRLSRRRILVRGLFHDRWTPAFGLRVLLVVRRQELHDRVAGGGHGAVVVRLFV